MTTGAKPLKLAVHRDDSDDRLPDLGLLLLAENENRWRDVHFENLEFLDIAVLSTKNEFSAVFRCETPISTCVASVVFGLAIFRKLVAALDPTEQQDYLASFAGEELPFMSTLPGIVVAESAVCMFGRRQRTFDGERFVPFKFRSLRKVRRIQSSGQAPVGSR